MWRKKPPFFRNLGCKGAPPEYCGGWWGEFQMSPVGAQLWVAVSYRFCKWLQWERSVLQYCKHWVCMLLPCIANAPHLCIVGTLIQNDRGARNLGSSVVVQIQVYVVETHQLIKLSWEYPWFLGVSWLYSSIIWYHWYILQDIFPRVPQTFLL